MSEKYIFVYYIEIGLKDDLKEFNKFEEYFIEGYLEESFSLGRTYLEKINHDFVVCKTENVNYLFEYIENQDKIKATKKLTNEVTEIDMTYKFIPFPNSKFYFTKMLTENLKLFGLDNIEHKVIKALNSEYCQSLCLYGPSGFGKRSLLKVLENKLTNKKFFWFDLNDAFKDRDKVKKLVDTLDYILVHSVDVVLCFPNVDNLGTKFDRVFHSHLKELMRVKQGTEIKLVFTVKCLQNLNSKLDYTCYNIFVPALNNHDKISLLKYTVESKTGCKRPEDVTDLVRALNGYSPRDIVLFVDKVQTIYPELTWNQLKECTKMDEFIPHSIVDLRANIEPLYWKDIGGYESVKKELQMAIQVPLENGRKPAKGILLYGPPGCSKTMFAMALATECQVSLFSVKPSSIMRPLLGESEAKLSEIISRAKASSPSILFIDEIDTLISERDDSREITVTTRLINELLTALDGVETKSDKPMIFVAATNRIDRLDKALIRPGRMDLIIEVGLPNLESRKSILKIIFSDNKFIVQPQVIDNIPIIANLLVGKSGADIVDVGRRIKNLAEYKVTDEVNNDNVIPVISINEVKEILSSFNEIATQLAFLSI